MLQFYTRITEKGKIGLLRDCPWDYLEEVMKKVLVSLLVLALAMTSAFAAVDITGEVVAGYVFNWDKDGNYKAQSFGQDNVATNPIKLNLGVADENGYWSVTMKGQFVADNRLQGKFDVDLGKLILGADSDLSIKLGMYADNRITGLRAYSNKSGMNLDRVRTYENGLWANLDVKYADLVEVQVGGGPGLVPGDEEGWMDAEKGDFIVSALVKPINGLAVSAGYVLNGEDKLGDGSSKGAVNAAADINIGDMLGTDFTVGLSVADKYAFDAKTNLFLATVYGGIDVVDVAFEYGLKTPEVGDMTHMIYLGVDLNVLEGLLLNIYGGSTNAAVGEAYYVGANVGYTVSNVTFKANLQYTGTETDTGNFGDLSEGAIKATGFSITPSIGVTF